MGNKTNKFINYFDGLPIKLEEKIALTKENPYLALKAAYIPLTIGLLRQE